MMSFVIAVLMEKSVFKITFFLFAHDNSVEWLWEYQLKLRLGLGTRKQQHWGNGLTLEHSAEVGMAQA